MTSTQDWKYDTIAAHFGEIGCSVNECSFNHPRGCKTDSVLCCALNLSDAIIQAGYTLPLASDVNFCNHASISPKRVRNADGMARTIKKQNSERIDASGWANRPAWKGIVYFEGGLSLSAISEKLAQENMLVNEYSIPFLATGHIDLWDGTKGVHAQYPDADIIWFWRLG